MYKNLSPQAIGVAGRQSELIELALTNGFRGLSLDIEHFARQAEKRGFEAAYQYLESAKMLIGGFALPTAWQADEATYQADLAKLPEIAELASKIGATRCHTTVMPASEELPYHENFEFHSKRLAEVAAVLGQHGIKLGLGFLAPASHAEGLPHSFINAPDALITLMKTIGDDNVGVVVDLWQWQAGGGTVAQIAELTADQIIEVNVADLPADVEAGSAEEGQRVLEEASLSEFLTSAMGEIAKLGYDGPVTPTPSPTMLQGRTRDIIVSGTSKAILRLWNTAGITKAGQYDPEAASQEAASFAPTEPVAEPSDTSDSTDEADGGTTTTDEAAPAETSA